MEESEKKVTGEPPKKGSLDSLSREELISKCKSLVGTLMKAKQDKEGMLARTRELEENLATFDEQKSADKNGLKAMQEIVDALTEQKLQTAVRMQELQDQCTVTSSKFAHLEKRNSELEIENESLQRQLKRISDENDDLNTEVSNLEGKLLTVNSIGEEQQKHFLQLEESTNKLLEMEGKYEEAKQTITVLEEDKRHLQSKMKAYKVKIIEIVAKFKKLRASHKATLEVVQEYSNSIPNWQEELRKVAEIITRNHKDTVDAGDEQKSHVVNGDDRVSELTTVIDDLKRQLDSNRKIMSQVESEKLQLIDEKSLLESRAKEWENKLMAKKQENSDLLQEMKELNEIMKERGETISKQQQELSQVKTSSDELQSDLQKIQTILTEREHTIRVLIEENKTREAPADDVASTSTVLKMDESMKEEQNEERYAKLKAMAVKLKKRLEEETKKVTALEEAQAVVSSLGGVEKIDELQKSLNEAIEREKAAKQETDKFRGFAKKYNMLALEMESYEKSMETQTEKLEQKQRIIKELEQTIEEQQGTMSSIKEQLRLVEARSTSEVNHSQGLHGQMEKLTANLKELEQGKVVYEERIESFREENHALKLQLDKVIGELELIKKGQEMENQSVLLERDKLQTTCSELEVQMRGVTKKLTEKEEECERLAKEYSGYKMRAQNILQQNQATVNSREKELEDELETTRRLIKSTEQSSIASLERIKELEKVNDTLVEEKAQNAKRFADTLTTLEVLKEANKQMQAENKQHLEERQSAIKSHRLNVDTLTGVFKGQMEEMENRLRDQEKTIQELSSSNRRLESIAKRSSTDEEKIVEMRLNLERQMTDENANAQKMLTYSGQNYQNSQQQHQRPARKVSSSNGLIPLEDLLNSNLDEEEVDYGASSSGYAINAEDEKKMLAKENQIKHLSTLLSEAEQDVAKLNQQNDLLKEEIRRQQRSEERDKHIHNSEYLKNVIFKFMTTKEEKIHLVPVLTTILKLSPAEVQKLQAVAKGTATSDSPRSGWTNYLPFK